VPILPREPDCFPPDLFEQLRGPQAPTGQWWVAYTLARREKDLMRQLRGVEIAHFGALAPKRTRSASGRVRTSYVPLFANYVFVFGGEDDRRRALASQCISHTLPVADSAQMTRDLGQICRLIAADAPLWPESKLESGERVRVRSGPLAGLEGVVVERRGERRLLVAVEFLQQGASLQMEDFQVERA
jgi:transcriptional antiterminator RfaH